MKRTEGLSRITNGLLFAHQENCELLSEDSVEAANLVARNLCKVASGWVGKDSEMQPIYGPAMLMSGLLLHGTLRTLTFNGKSPAGRSVGKETIT